MIIPKGEHKIEFKFEPRAYYLGTKISRASSIILIILLIGILYVELRKYDAQLKPEKNNVD